MAEKFKDALKKRGPSGVGMFGSGQWTIWEGYAASKLFKAGFRSNNIDPNARHCMASAVGRLHAHLRHRRADGLLRRYRGRRRVRAVGLEHGRDAPDPVDPGRPTAGFPRRMSASPCSRPSSIARSTSPTSAWCSSRRPTSIILNAIANHIIKTGRVNKDFVAAHTIFKRGQTDIGYGLRPEHPLQKKATGARQGQRRHRHELRRIRQVRLATTRWRRRPRCPACRSNRLEALAELYADPKTKVISFWTMGFNQHTRGVWCNNLVYNIHLLTGKISEPGNSPFSLTGQPSACGTAREVGTFSHRLPADMVVTNKAHRDNAEQIWKLPEGTIPDKPGYHAVLQNRMLKDGLLNAYWVQVNNNLQAGANANEETYPGYRNPDNFIVVSDAYPSVTALAADLILPTAMWVEKEGAYGNAERRTHFWHQLVDAPGRVALRSLAAHGVLQALQDRGSLAGGADRQEAGVPRQDAVRRAVQERPGRQIPAVATSRPATPTTSPRRSASTCRRACSRNTPRSAAATATTSRRSTPIIRCAACAGRSSTARRRAGASARARSLCRSRAPASSSTAFPDGKARIFALPYEPPAGIARTTNIRSGSRPAACWSTGIPAP